MPGTSASHSCLQPGAQAPPQALVPRALPGAHHSPHQAPTARRPPGPPPHSSPVPQSHMAQGPPHGPNRHGPFPPTAGVGAPAASRSRSVSPQASWALRGSPPSGASDVLPGHPISPHAGRNAV
ncbi:hypothetical protein NDU88_001872 [Pleurodeles waltl]|uniref:Uncharacterized protein n=1 Tax=Pleurodeles waltl TaxID=8319 RepID=A0AAV7U7N0_PLEWA|nr:hypothetical protein NDU88_001872 [Pleurodeles waltl]